MKIPRYWARINRELSDSDQRTFTGSVLGWSESSHADALQHAAERAKRIHRVRDLNTTARWYEYGDRPIREEIVEVLEPGTQLGIITRNRYGALVLNSDSVPFIDIDVKQDHPLQGGSNIKESSTQGLFSWLFGKPKPITPPAADPFQKIMSSLKFWISRNSRQGLRLYRTPNGYRGILTNELLEPAGLATARIMQELGTDPLYMRLCSNQQCFRARVTAKPWRIGIYSYYPGASLVENDAKKDLLTKKWISDYESKQQNFAACKFIEQLGVQTIDPKISKIIEVHDRISGALSSRPLA